MQKQANQIKIDLDGKIHFIWSDTFVELAELGRSTIRRASHVEPNPDGQWEADLSPSDGPQLGPFRTRSEALNAEISWLEGELQLND